MSDQQKVVMIIYHCYNYHANVNMISSDLKTFSHPIS